MRVIIRRALLGSILFLTACSSPEKMPVEPCRKRSVTAVSDYCRGTSKLKIGMSIEQVLCVFGDASFQNAAEGKASYKYLLEKGQDEAFFVFESEKLSTWGGVECNFAKRTKSGGPVPASVDGAAGLAGGSDLPQAGGPAPTSLPAKK